jgi:5-methylcytosine-specific restriction endonuclease McrA
MSTASDPKPTKRTKDPALMATLHRAYRGTPCMAGCGNLGMELHHWALRSQGGDDTVENLRWVCFRCHRALHGNPWTDSMGVRWDAARVKETLSG